MNDAKKYLSTVFQFLFELSTDQIHNDSLNFDDHDNDFHPLNISNGRKADEDDSPVEFLSKYDDEQQYEKTIITRVQNVLL